MEPIRGLTTEEMEMWRKRLFNRLEQIGITHPALKPLSNESIDSLLDVFLLWAERYSGGYFHEMDDAGTDRYCAWLVGNYEIRTGKETS